MRIRTDGRVLVLGLLLALPASATGITATARILRLEHTWLKASQERDLAVLKRVLARDYVDIDYQGMVRDRADMLAAPNVRRRNTTQQLRDERVRLFGDTAILTGRGELEDTARRHVVATWRFTDVFVRQRGAWRAVSSQETIVRTPHPPARAAH